VRQQRNTKDTHSILFSQTERERERRRRRDKNSDRHLDEKKREEEEEDFNIIARFILPSSKSQKSLRVTVCLILSYEEEYHRVQDHDEEKNNVNNNKGREDNDDDDNDDDDEYRRKSEQRRVRVCDFKGEQTAQRLEGSAEKRGRGTSSRVVRIFTKGRRWYDATDAR
jgi:hypothetical protein